jgi:DNA invertase Pin-like site-specific DNA recombinase
MNVDTLLPSGEENTYATMLVTMLGLGAQMERSLIMGRLNSGRKHAMENGVVMGRKPGSVKTREQKEKEYANVIKLLKKGTSIRNTAKLCNVSPKTVQAVKNEFVKKF